MKNYQNFKNPRPYLLFILFCVFSCSALETKTEVELKIIYPGEWGGRDSVYNYEAQRIEAITIHHSGVFFEDSKNVPNYLKNLQEWSRNEKKWVDIPYHYIIDHSGNIYQCRDPRIAGDTNTEYDPTGHLLISVLGNYQEQLPTTEMLASLKLLIQVKAVEYQIDRKKLFLHQDLADTECPGKNIVIWFKEQDWLKK